jgi:hypothetical protein
MVHCSAALWQSVPNILQELPEKQTCLPKMHIWVSRKYQQSIPKCYYVVVPPVLSPYVDELCQHLVISVSDLNESHFILI